MSTRQKRRVVGKAASYALNPAVDGCGTVFTNRGAVGAVTFTLYRPNRAALGDFHNFRCVAGQNLIVAGLTAGDIVTFNNAAAASVALQTGGQLIGGAMRAECIETVEGTFKWQVIGLSVGHTFTVA